MGDVLDGTLGAFRSTGYGLTVALAVGVFLGRLLRKDEGSRMKDENGKQTACGFAALRPPPYD